MYITRNTAGLVEFTIFFHSFFFFVHAAFFLYHTLHSPAGPRKNRTQSQSDTDTRALHKVMRTLFQTKAIHI